MHVALWQTASMLSATNIVMSIDWVVAAIRDALIDKLVDQSDYQQRASFGELSSNYRHI